MSNEERISILEKKREKINSVSCSFCTAKWLQTTLYLQNGYNHSCHHPSPHKISVEEILQDPAALHNSNFKKQQRQKMLNGERPSECDYCWNIEDLNKTYFSDRHYKTADYWAWDRFDEIAHSDPKRNVTPSYLEVSFSNVCNFACAYCSPEISSKWMEDIQQNGLYPTEHSNHDLNYLKSSGRFPYRQSDNNPYVNAFWKWFPEILSHLRVLRLTGGEPTMSKDVWKLLNYIENNPQPNLELAINTNLCVTQALINRLQEKISVLKNCVKKIDIYTSLESIGKQAEYVRDGLDYNQWVINVEKILETGVNVSIMTTVNILSLPTFANFIEKIMELRVTYNKSFETNRIPLSVNYLRWPPHLQCILLDNQVREEFADTIEYTCKKWLKYYSKDKYARLYLEEWDQIQRLCDYLRTSNSVSQYRKDFVRYILEYDKRRNKNFNKVFPEYTYLLEDWRA